MQIAFMIVKILPATPLSEGNRTSTEGHAGMGSIPLEVEGAGPHLARGSLALRCLSRRVLGLETGWQPSECRQKDSVFSGVPAVYRPRGFRSPAITCCKLTSVFIFALTLYFIAQHQKCVFHVVGL